ncbi:hypothetical protein A9Q83_13595 [Alphaproteobacteria bacterium 46_93_T64]|nr:hypothetical protein A9Q83_13595 [Alphaproteobacteria bacterium 46_93_T64]
MSFHDVRFPTRISYGAIGGPRFSTTVQTLNSGHEQRNINWADARREYKVDIAPSRGSEWDDLLSFFHARRGRTYGFRLKDFSDFKIKDGEIGVADGIERYFKIKKIYQDPYVISLPYERTIQKIVDGSLSVFVNDVAQFGNWSADNNTGLVTFTGAPTDGAIISINCEFDVPVRFDSDLMEASIPGPDIHLWQSVKLVEVRP